jgi:hypothetical protein
MNKVSNAIRCVNCRNVMDSPVFLPCGCSICEKHTRDASINKETSLLCCKCEIEHEVPTNGRSFPPNAALAEIIDAQLGNLTFGHEHNDAKESCARLDELLTTIECILKDPNNFNYEAIEYLKSVAQLKADESKMRIDDNLTHLITKLDEFKANCKSNLGSSEYLTKADEFWREKEASRLELDKWLVTLNELKLNEPEWKRIKSESEKAIERFEIELAKFKSESLLQKRFEAYRADVENNFGTFELDPRFKFR